LRQPFLKPADSVGAVPEDADNDWNEEKVEYRLSERECNNPEEDTDHPDCNAIPNTVGLRHVFAGPKFV